MDWFVRLLLLLLFLPGVASAERVSWSLQEFRLGIADGRQLGASLTPEMLSQLQATYAELGLRWEAGGLSLALPVPGQSLASDCSLSAELERMDAVFLLQDEALLSLQMTSLQGPIVLEIDAPFLLEGSGEVTQRFGVSAFGRCRRYGKDSFDIGLQGSGRLQMRVVLDPGVALTRTDLTVTPRFAVEIQWRDLDYAVDVDHTAAAALIEDRLRSRIDALFSPAHAAATARQLEQGLRQRRTEAWGGDALTIALPQLDDAQFADLQQIMGRELAWSVGDRYLRDHMAALWYSLLTGDRKQGAGVLTAALSCEVTAQKLLPLNAKPLFTLVGNDCRRVEAEAISGLQGVQRYFADGDCRQSINVTAMSQQQFCRNQFDGRRVGNGALLPVGSSAWYLSPGTRSDFALVSTAGLVQPWVNARRYKTVETDAGTCVLEMRIYKNDIAATGLRPMLALHGGNWQYRSRGMLGIEATVPQFTARGFVVFAPFYRLAGDAEGTAACRNARGEEILADVGDALAWVNEHAAAYGADNGKVVVTGQSAGAHLAAWLATHYPQQIARSLLLYPPTDMADYLQQWQLGEPGVSPDGVEVLRTFLKLAEPEDIDLSMPLVQDNSLPQIVAQAPAEFPPMFLIHGSADDVVPMRQSARLCNALAGNPDAGPAPMALDDAGASIRVNCDQRGSQFHAIAGAGHMLDFCLTPSLCAAGTAEGQDAARQALREGYDWVASPVGRVAAVTQERATGGGSAVGVTQAHAAGGGAVGLGWLLILTASGRRRVRGKQKPPFRKGRFGGIGTAEFWTGEVV